jgi:hypothetical protein
MPVSSNHTEVSVHCCHGKHTVAILQTLLSNHIWILVRYLFILEASICLATLGLARSSGVYTAGYCKVIHLVVGPILDLFGICKNGNIIWWSQPSSNICCFCTDSLLQKILWWTCEGFSGVCDQVTERKCVFKLSVLHKMWHYRHSECMLLWQLHP